VDVRTLRSRQAIIEAGLTLFLHNDDATLVDIAKAANLGRATVYRQFTHKEQLQEAIALYCLDRFDEVNGDVEARATDDLDAIRLVLQNTLPLFAEFEFLRKSERFLSNNSEFQARSQTQNDELRDLINLAMKHGLLNDTFSVEWIFHLFEGLLWAGYQATQSGICSSAQAAELAFHSFINGVGQR
jgi:AcrR family transcriptional regulator